MSRRRTPKQQGTIKEPALSQQDDPNIENYSTANSLLDYHQLPEWLQDNAYILSSYRPPSGSIKTSLLSTFSIHNETVNIQTHLFGALAFFVLAWCSFPPSLPNPPFPSLTLPLNMPALYPFYLGAVTCLGLSASFHATSNVSPEVARWGNQADYLGILALIIGSFVSSIYYGFHCHPHLQKVYWTMISTIGVACGVVTVNPRFRSPAWRAWRAAMFVTMGLSAVIPVIHGLSIYGLDGMEDRIALRWLVSQGVTYVAGAGIYALRVPERWKPRTFDVFGASHQIFHIFVLVAAGIHLIGLLKAAGHKASETGICEDII
jgi:adiponectin receptor